MSLKNNGVGVRMEQADADGNLQKAISLLNPFLVQFILITNPNAKINKKTDFNQSLQSIIGDWNIFFPKESKFFKFKKCFSRAKKVRNLVSHQAYDCRKYRHDMKFMAKLATAIGQPELTDIILKLVEIEESRKTNPFLLPKEEDNHVCLQDDNDEENSDVFDDGDFNDDIYDDNIQDDDVYWQHDDDEEDVEDDDFSWIQWNDDDEEHVEDDDISWKQWNDDDEEEEDDDVYWAEDDEREASEDDDDENEENDTFFHNFYDDQHDDHNDNEDVLHDNYYDNNEEDEGGDNEESEDDYIYLQEDGDPDKDGHSVFSLNYSNDEEKEDDDFSYIDENDDYFCYFLLCKSCQAMLSAHKDRDEHIFKIVIIKKYYRNK